MPEHVRHLTPFDAQFLAAEAGNMTSNYCALALVAPDAEGRLLTHVRVRALIESRIDRIPALRWRLVPMPLGLDYPAFADGTVDLDRHVFARTLPAPGTDRELGELVAELLSAKMDRRHPLWQFHVVDGLADGRIAVAMVFHHAAADAMAATTLMSLLLDPDPAGREDLPGVVPTSEPTRRRDLWMRSANRGATHPVRAARAGASALPHLDQVPMMRTLPGVRGAAGAARRVRRLFGSDTGSELPFLHAPRTRFNSTLSPGRSVAFGAVHVRLIKDLKTAHGVSFNDIVMAGVGGGLRRRLIATGELPDDPLLAFVPTNVRTAADDGHITNAISSYVAPVPTHVSDPGGRIRAAHAGMSAVKERHLTAPTTLLEDANALIFPIVFAPLAAGMMRLLGSGVIAPPVNMVLSNVPGPPMLLHLDGAPVEAISPHSLVFDGATLNITVVSYHDRLEIGVVGDREAVSDAWEIMRDIEAEFADMHAALVAA